MGDFFLLCGFLCDGVPAKKFFEKVCPAGHSWDFVKVPSRSALFSFSQEGTILLLFQ